MEIKAELDKIENLIDNRARRRFEESYKVVRVYPNIVIENLKKAKKAIKEENKKAEKLWKEGMEAYFDYMKKHVGSKQMGNMPEKPRMPREYDTIDGYIDMFSSLVDKEISLEIEYLEKIYLEMSRGISNAKETTASTAFFCSGAALGVADFSLTTNRGDYEWK